MFANVTNLFVPIDKRKPHFIQWWSSIQQRGATRYIFLNGLYFASTLAVLFIILQALYNSAFYISTAGLIIGGIGLLVGGALFGWGMWAYNQRVYKFLVQDR